MLLDKPAYGVLRASRPIGSGIGIVQEHRVDAAAEAAFVALDVRLNRDPWLDGSTGTSTSENAATVCGLPSSKI